MTSNGPVFPLKPLGLLLEVVALKHSKWKSYYNLKKKKKKNYQVYLISKAYTKLYVITERKIYNLPHMWNIIHASQTA